MQVTITVSEELASEARRRGLSVSGFVEQLVDKGFAQMKERTSVSSAIERIRALRSAPQEPRGV
jgi:hypothetical protein